MNIALESFLMDATTFTGECGTGVRQGHQWSPQLLLLQSTADEAIMTNIDQCQWHSEGHSSFAVAVQLDRRLQWRQADRIEEQPYKVSDMYSLKNFIGAR